MRYMASVCDLADECVRFGMAPQSAAEPDPMAGKVREVVLARTFGLQTQAGARAGLLR
jgi:hypothetical protein